MTREQVNQLASAVFERLVGADIRLEEARLYSQHTKLKNRQPGLKSWGNEEGFARLKDAVALVHAGEILRENNDDRWRWCFLRCGDLLECLTNPSLKIFPITLRLLSAAAYDVAGYPARANAILGESEPNWESLILRSFLQGNLSTSLSQIIDFWKTHLFQPQENPSNETNYENSIAIEVLRSLGVVCSALRWGNENRLEVALKKLEIASTIHASEKDQYSWLLSKLVSMASREHTTHSWRSLLYPLIGNMSEMGQVAIESYCRLAYLQGHSRAWPYQEEGVRRIFSDGSFALCTPTGSGKTSIAEIALIKAVSGEKTNPQPLTPLALYIVPSRALAAEVEAKLSRIFRQISIRNIGVTGLYGGSDWGPMEAWLNTDVPSIIVCTFEKAEALLRFLGSLIFPRLNLVIYDEAHAVQFDGNFFSLRQGENRSLRLESLGMRLSQMIDRSRCRIIALSAVAAGLEDSLHRWATGIHSGPAVTGQYRSTRQLIGRLIVDASGFISLFYDIMDGRILNLSRDSESTPYVPNVIPKAPKPPQDWFGPEKSLRPVLLWTAIHFAAPDDQGHRHSVLISLTQQISGHAKDFLELLDSNWGNLESPLMRTRLSTGQQTQLYETLEVCSDYFGTESYEYRLLEYGIAIHHSNMPKSLSRRIVELINSQTIYIVVATSTLSEGINIPVETILVPSLYRWEKNHGRQRISASEFKNLSGRAGRPGVATEGRTLVIFPKKNKSDFYNLNRVYENLLTEIVHANQNSPQGPLVNAIEDIWKQWQQITRDSNPDLFLEWLERVSIQEATFFLGDTSALDSLDLILLGGIVEQEEMSPDSDWEARLQGLWDSSFASYLASNFHRRAFIRRGTAVPRLYPERRKRRELYKTGLPPSTAVELIQNYLEISTLFNPGSNYAKWSKEERFTFLTSVVGALGQISRFRIPGHQVDWVPILKWWLRAEEANFPAANKIAEWHKFVGKWFSYRICWGLGSVIGYAYELEAGGEMEATSLDHWEDTGLPWIVFWLKELFSWGTLEPVAAFLLGRGLFLTRSEAEQAAIQYYGSGFAGEFSDPLNPRSIRNWVEGNFPNQSKPERKIARQEFQVEITDPAVSDATAPFKVVPIITENAVCWVDVGGYSLGQSAPEIAGLIQEMGHEKFDYLLRPADKIVETAPYL